MRDLSRVGWDRDKTQVQVGEVFEWRGTGVYLCVLGGGGSELSVGFGGTGGKRKKVGFMLHEDCPG